MSIRYRFRMNAFITPMICVGIKCMKDKLRVVKAFRSSLEEFDERRSIASTHSVQSMRGGWSRLVSSPDPTGTRAAIAALSHRHSPQPYPYYHHQQPRTPSPQPQIVVENGSSSVVGLNSTSPSPAVCSAKLEKVPLVQKWSPDSNSSYSQRISKSMSLDTPVSVAHV
ncbi:hypothetical protein DICVIV_09194 [Dictyocaulus viviparus]|uniref:Uncharacterized protein n=1 Tax=Dictyocaulus viviparus TaxID=29172 RepID=A0A0D8XM04_DICVI|nr:hypothetical protein DICVIV_09194 [Dictyocaulus viviparus]